MLTHLHATGFCMDCILLQNSFIRALHRYADATFNQRVAEQIGHRRVA